MFLKRYDLCLGTQTVGHATVERQGLYYRITCQCRLTGSVRFRVTAIGSCGEADLGLLVPRGKDYYLSTSIAVKRIGEDVTFRLESGHRKAEGRFVPISKEEPFAYLTGLKDAVLCRKNEQWGIVIQGLSSKSTKPTGQ